MTDHPCKGMTPSQIEVFEQVATGNALPAAHRKTLAKLEGRGLIERSDDKQLGDRMGKFAIPQYFVPLLIHWQWCQWCSEQPENSE